MQPSADQHARRPLIAHGERHPRLVDDRLAMVLIVLDGLGDRPLRELDGQTPAEAATTPMLDAMAARGVSGIHLPFGPGRAPSSELSHWAMFGYDRYPFCGRAVLEARGRGIGVSPDRVYSYAALRTSDDRDGVVWITGRAAPSDEDDARALLDAIGDRKVGGLTFRLVHLRWGEALLEISGGASPDVTDADPFFEHLHPWLEPTAFEESEAHQKARLTAAALTGYLHQTRRVLADHQVNRDRQDQGLPTLDVLTTKWTGEALPVPSFYERIGTSGAAVTSSSMYRGLAATLGMKDVFVPPGADVGADLEGRLEIAAGLLVDGATFVHVHTKATDEAGHSKDPRAKLEVLESLDGAFSRVSDGRLGDAVVVVTGDHATPSRDSVLHSGDSTPLVAAAPTLAPDGVNRFGESFAQHGSLGSVRARDLMPLMLGFANRPAFLGTRITEHRSLGLPDTPRPMAGSPPPRPAGS